MAKLKARVLEATNKFLGTLKLPKWVKLGDNELRYMLWRSHENLRGKGKDSLVDVARDVAKRNELKVGSEVMFAESREQRELREVNNDFNQKLNQLNEGAKRGGELQLGKPGAILKASGIIGDRITLDWDVLSKKRNESYHHDHPFDIEDIKDLPYKINAPIAVFMSTGHGDYNILIEAEHDGKNFIVSLKARSKKTRGGSIVVEEVVTLYPKEEKGVVYWLNNGMGRYLNKEKTLEWLSRREPHAHNYTIQELEDAAKLVKNFENPKIETSESEILFRDPGETDDIWSDMSVGLEERVTAARIRLANNQADNLDMRDEAVRAIGGNLTSLRRAMAAQRKFDQTTVKRVTDLAKILMQGGYLSGMTNGEMQRLLSAVKNSVGHKEVTESVQKIMDVMVDNQLRNGENTFRELLKVKGSKVDARGVEVQGALDVEGQRLLEVVKRTHKMDEKDLENDIADALSRMGSPNRVTAENAAVEYDGLNISLEYSQR